MWDNRKILDIRSSDLEAIIQLPNNLFYNTGITTYVWLLSNRKEEKRKGKVQLIDASNLYRKLRKNLGQKNCEFSDEHIQQITQLYLGLAETDISKVFDNRDFGYYKLTIERPLRLAAQFTPERVATLRFHPALLDVMEWAYGKYGEAVYDGLADHAETIESHLEREEISLSPRQRKELLSPTLWQEQRGIMEKAEKLMGLAGQTLSLDFNAFVKELDAAVEGLGFKLPASERKQIQSAVSWGARKPPPKSSRNRTP